VIVKNSALLLERIGRDKKTIFIFLLSTFLFCLRDGAIFSPDSNSYIGHSLIRMGTYPLIISFFQFLFKDYAFQILVGLQLILSLIAPHLMSSFFTKSFNLPWQIHWVLLFVFLLPIVALKSANDILSEALAYPLFLLASYFFLKGIFQTTIKDLYMFCFMIFLLTFTRQQYIFYYGIALSSLVYLHLFQHFFKKKSQFLLAIVLSLSTYMISERSYHYVYHNSFSGTPFTGEEIINRPLFLATEDSYKLFKDPKQSLFVETAVLRILKKNLMDAEPAKRELNLFYLNSNIIHHQIVSPLLEEIWDKKTLKDDMGDTYSEFEFRKFTDQQAISITLTLIKNNFLSYMKNYIKDVMRGFGGYAYFAIVFFITILLVWNCIMRKNINLFHLSFVFSSLIHLGNLSLVCLVEPPILRYTYSTGLLLFAMLLILGYQFTTLTLLKKSDVLCVE
jgi:hypothetical protein